MITYREVTEEDIDYLWGIYSDESSMKYFGRSIAETKEEVKGVINQNIEGAKNHEMTRYLAFDNKKFIGFITIKRYDSRFHRAEIDYIIAPAVRRQGYGSEMMQFFLRKIFEEWDLTRITAYVDPDNIASQKLLEKNNFLREGLLRDWTREGENSFIYGFIANDL